MKSRWAIGLALTLATPAMAQIKEARVTGARRPGPWSRASPSSKASPSPPAQVANLDRLKVLDSYYDWRREGAH